MTTLGTSVVDGDRGLDGDPEPVTVVCARRAEVAAPTRLLFVHGLASGRGTWRAIVDIVDPRCELWVADMPWRGIGVPGWTAAPVEHWIDVAVSAVPHGPDVIVAHSFATSAVLAWLDQRGVMADARVAGAILVSPLYRRYEADFDWHTLTQYVDRFDEIIYEGIRHHAGPRASAARDVASRVRDLIGPLGWVRFFETYLRTPRFRVERLALPVLIVSGTADTVAHPSDARALADALPGATLATLPGEHHFPMVTAAPACSRVFNDFLVEFTTPPPSGCALGRKPRP